MFSVKVTRSNALDGVYQHAHIAGPYDDKVDADYHAKQLRTSDPNQDSVYEVVPIDWVVVVTRGKGKAAKSEVVSWHEDEDDAKANAAMMQRGDYTVIVEPKHWPLK